MKKTATYLIIAALAVYVGYIIYKLMKPFTYFTYSEFDSPDQPGSGEQYMSKEFIRKLDKIRNEVGFPMKITSGYRSITHNAKVGGVPNSAHTKGLAADISTPNKKGQNAIIKAALKQGITRFGIAQNFVHLDIDPEKRQQITWGYGGSVPSFSELQNLA